MRATALLFVFILSVPLSAGELSTGNIRRDLLNASPSDSGGAPPTVLARPSLQGAQKKNPLMAAGMSLLLPGAGQAYTGNYWKTGIMVAVEAAAIAVAVLYTRKGDDKTTEFQNYADAHWSAVRYAQWMNSHGEDYNLTGNAGIVINSDASLPSWQRVSFAEINAWESQQKRLGFSHMLPAHGEQQFYELIGKYDQFKFGWDEYIYGWAADGTPNSDDKNYFSIPQQMVSYSANRGKANDFYNTAAIAVGAIVVNHLASSLEAFFSTRSDNEHVVQSEIGFHLDQVGVHHGLATDLTVHLQL